MDELEVVEQRSRARGRFGSVTATAVGPWMAIPRAQLAEREIADIAAKLTLVPVKRFGPRSKKEDGICAYKVTDRYVYMLRGFAVHELGICATEGRDRTSMGMPIGEDVRFNGALRSREQRAVVDGVDQHMRKHADTGGAIALVSAQPGCGKTVMLLNMLATLWRRKALIIVRGRAIVSQWVDKVRLFLPRAKVGVIHQNAWQVRGRDVVIASADTLASRAGAVRPAIWDEFGLVCFDEAHHIVAATLVRVYLTCVRARLCVALTGTPDRKDGLTYAMPWFIGPAVGTMRNTEPINVHMLRFDEGKREVVRIKWGPDRGKLDSQSMLARLAEDERRNAMLVRVVCDCLRAGRKVLVLTWHQRMRTLLRDGICAWAEENRDALARIRRVVPVYVVRKSKMTTNERRVARVRALLDRAHVEGDDAAALDKLARLPDALAADARAVPVGLVDVSVMPDIVESGTTQPAPWAEEICDNDSALARRHKFDAHVVLGTYDMAREALDLDGLNTLVLAGGVSDTRQVTGRVRRGWNMARCDPNASLLEQARGLVVDVVDTFAPFDRWADARMRFYRSEADCMFVSRSVLREGEPIAWRVGPSAKTLSFV